jgi:hypothetical protein
MIVFAKVGHHDILSDISEAIHMRQIHCNLPLEVVESAIMFFSIQLLVKCEIVCVITLIDGNG